MAVRGAERRKRMDARLNGNYHSQEVVGVTGVKVTVHIPGKVLNRREIINRIYDILVPEEENRK